MPSVPKNRFVSSVSSSVGAVILFGWLSLATALSFGSPLLVVPPATQDADVQPEPRQGHLIKVRLPIDDREKDEIRASLDAIVDAAPMAVRLNQRPVVVLEFDTRGGKTGRGSDREACQSLARTLTDRRFNPIETIAYIPANEALGVVADEDGTRLVGHAVLVALAANQLALAPGTSIGDAGIDEPTIDDVLSSIYRTYPGQRGRLPEPMVASMLDPSLGLASYVQDGQTLCVSMAELEDKEKKGLTSDAKELASVGERAVLSAEQLQTLGYISLVPKTKTDLERDLGLTQGTLKYRLSDTRVWNAVQLELPYSVDEKAERWVIRSLLRSRENDVNLVIVTIDESVGEAAGCLAIAQQLAELRQQDVQTVAFVRGDARGAVGIIALACDHLIMSSDATLGGFDGEVTGLEKGQLDDLRPTVKLLAKAAEKDWSVMMAMLDPGLVVTQYRDTEGSGQVRLMTEKEELELGDDLKRWKPQEVLSVSSGLNSKTAERFGLTKYIAEDMDQLQGFYQLSDPPKRIELSSAERWVDQIANFFRNPVIGLFLLLGAFFFISNEMSAPGLGVPGFLGTLCVVLYFWSHWFGGETQLFEILMFILGLVFIGLEIFVIPGFGIFGIGGILLVVVSLVLAGQDFVIPMNGKDWAQVPYSLMPIIGAGLGMVAAVFFLQAAIEKSPFLSRFVLDTNDREDTGLGEGDPEATANWGYLLGKKGVTVTRLNPAGKAKIDGSVYDVISTGLMLDKATKVEVVEAVANRIVVQTIES
ncbi:hypothetical protein N9Y42_02175 [Mariniblastus sp.]|nr:hypothetical protein [Mariniblastus sp.]